GDSRSAWLMSLCKEPVRDVPPCSRWAEPAALTSPKNCSRVERIRLVASSGQIDVALSARGIGLVQHRVGKVILLLARWPVLVFHVEQHFVSVQPGRRFRNSARSPVDDEAVGSLNDIDEGSRSRPDVEVLETVGIGDLDGRFESGTCDSDLGRDALGGYEGCPTQHDEQNSQCSLHVPCLLLRITPNSHARRDPIPWSGAGGVRSGYLRQRRFSLSLLCGSSKDA